MCLLHALLLNNQTIRHHHSNTISQHNRTADTRGNRTNVNDERAEDAIRDNKPRNHRISKLP